MDAVDVGDSKEINGCNGERTRVIDVKGKFADIIVLDRNLFDLEKVGRLDRIGETRVLKTILGGDVVDEAMPPQP